MVGAEQCCVADCRRAPSSASPRWRRSSAASAASAYSISLSGSISEGVVSAVLWDMHDRTNESKDTLSGLDPAHWAVMRGYLGADTEEYDGGRGYSGRDLIDFLDGWLCHHGDSRNGETDSKGLRGNVRGIHECE